MQYEYLFWSMAALVAAALAVGSLCGRMASAGRTFAGVAVWAIAVLAGVALLAPRGGFGDMTGMLAIAAAMFTLVIASASALLTRRIRRRREAGRQSSSSSSSSSS